MRTAKQDGAVPVEPAGSQQPNSDDNLDSNYNENENDAEGISADGAEKSDDDNVNSAESETDDTHWQAHNARSPVWRLWEDQLLVGQVDSDRLFEKPRRARSEAWDSVVYKIGRSNPSFQHTGEACKARFNVYARNSRCVVIF
jgi:hypothetical protein